MNRPYDNRVCCVSWEKQWDLGLPSWGLVGHWIAISNPLGYTCVLCMNEFRYARIGIAIRRCSTQSYWPTKSSTYWTKNKRKTSTLHNHTCQESQYSLFFIYFQWSWVPIGLHQPFTKSVDIKVFAEQKLSCFNNFSTELLLMLITGVIIIIL